MFQSQGRSEIMMTLEKVVGGVGSAGSGTFKDVYKATKQCMTDRAMSVRFSAAKVGKPCYPHKNMAGNTVLFS